MSNPSEPRIAIVGAGIGGLTLALALRQRGVAASVFEQSPQLTEIGAAVALSANATRDLGRLGVLDDLVACATEPSELIHRDWRTGRRVAAHDVAHEHSYRRRFGAPYLGIHRADLQRVLGAAMGGGVHLDHRLVGIEDAADAVRLSFANGHVVEAGVVVGADGVRLSFANGHVVEAGVVVGADGVRSLIRRWITGTTGTRYSGTSAFRGIVPQDRLPSLPDPTAIQFWMGPEAHLLHYAIGGDGGQVNFFAVTEGPAAWPDPSRWVVDVPANEAATAFAGWHPAVTEMVGAGWVTKRWGLFVVDQPRRWCRGRAVILGDAAHAMLPHHGQGANTTIEDAITLAELLPGASAANWDERMARYHALRRLRTRKIQRSSWATNALLHRPDGPALADRDDRVSRFPERFAWIHDHDAQAAASLA